MDLLRIVGEVIRWSLFAVTAIYLLTGFGITEYRIVEQLTLGLLSKALSFRVHISLEIPFVVLLLLHISFRPIAWIYHKLGNGKHTEDA